MARQGNSPFLAKKILQFIASLRGWDTAVQDLDEVYQEDLKQKGRLRANGGYWLHVLRLVPAVLRNFVYWQGNLFRNHLKFSIRHLMRSRTSSAINFCGLAVGLASVLFILLYLQNEFRYDRHHANANRIYQVKKIRDGQSGVSASMPAPLAEALLNEASEVEAAVRINAMGSVHVSANEINCFEKGFIFADPSFFDVFTVPFFSGGPSTLSNHPFSLVISKTMAQKYFGDADPVGRVMSYKGKTDFTVAGVFKDHPKTSTLTYHFIAPFRALEKMNSRYKASNWNAFSYQIFILLREGVSIETVPQKINAILSRHLDAEIASLFHLQLDALTSIHIQKARMPILVFSAVAFLILVIAIMNYANLTTARSFTRFREIGLRKAIGATRRHIVAQVFGDSFLLVMLAFALALGLVILFLPGFNRFLGMDISLSLLQTPELFIGLLGLMVLAGVASGFYPALEMACLQAADAFRDTRIVSGKAGFRNGLIVFQFVVTTVLFAATLIMSRQLRFISTRDLGFDQANIMIVDGRDSRIQSNVENLRAELKQIPGVTHVSASACLPNFTDWASNVAWPGQLETQELAMYLNFVDESFARLYNLELVEGRLFSRRHNDREKGAFLLNESAVRALGWKSPVGRTLTHFIGRRTGTVVGVVRDFHLQSLHEAIEPLCLDLHTGQADSWISVKFDSGYNAQQTARVKAVFARFAPGYPFVMRSFDSIIRQDYASEMRVQKLFQLFSGLAVIIAGMGLLGLTSFLIQRKTREIGIRKVLGASQRALIFHLSGQLGRSVFIANVIAWPLMVWIARFWLQRFAYHIALDWSLLAMPALLSVAIAAATVWAQTIKAARANPVEALRYE